MNSKYHIELVNPAGEMLADLSGRASSRRLIQSRNEAEEISWRVDLNELERYGRLTNQDPRNFLINNQTEVRIRRLGSYLAGGQLVLKDTALTGNGQYIDIRATGFLNLFKSRYTDAERLFTDTQATTIAATLIEETQTGDNASFGVTVGTLATVGVHDRTYRRTNIKDALQALTRVQVAPFDFAFTYDKVFNTYVQLGSSRPDVVFEWPGNMTAVRVIEDGTGVANKIIALGSGFGEIAQAQYVAEDVNSQLDYKIREKIVLSNATDNSDNGLTDAANTELAAWSRPFELPSPEIDGNREPVVTSYGIGDWVRMRITGYRTLDHIDALYRVEHREIDIDEDDNERVKLIVSR